MSKRPLAVTIIAWVYLVVGAAGFAAALFQAAAQRRFDQGLAWVELLRLLAVLAGAYLLRARNWARWLALAWMAFHVVLSAFHALPELAIHALFCSLIGYFLFRRAANGYFRTAGT